MKIISMYVFLVQIILLKIINVNFSPDKIASLISSWHWLITSSIFFGAVGGISHLLFPACIENKLKLYRGVRFRFYLRFSGDGNDDERWNQNANLSGAHFATEQPHWNSERNKMIHRGNYCWWICKSCSL